jgi:CHAT domain-containing protein/Tfp pilus assembly protein PilF
LLTEALAMVKATNPMLEALVRNRLGVLYGRTGEPERAIHEFTEVLRVARLLQAFRLEGGTLNNLGIATKDLGEFRSSLAYYQQSLQVTRTQGRRADQTNTLNNIGNLQRLLGEHEQALDSHRQALAIARESGDVDNEGRALNTIGFTLYRLGEFRQALDYHEQALAIRRRIADRAGEASALDGIGLAWHRLGHSDQALAALNDSLRIRRSIAARLGETDTLRHLALVERDRGNLSAALDQVVAAVALTDSLRDRVVSPDLRASFVAGEQEQYELQIDILMQLHLETRQAGFLMRALEASERGRARVLLESLRESRANVRQGIDPALLDQQRGLQRQLDRASTRLSQVLSRDSPPADVDAARRTIETLSERYTQLQVRIREESPAYAALTQAEATTVLEIQRDLLDADTLLLEYALGDERSWLWMVASDTVASFELPPRREIESAARRFYQLLTARQPNPSETHTARATRIARADRDLRREASGLGRTLLGPVASRLAAAWPGKRLLVVAPALLQHIPFSSLIDPGNGTEPVVIDHEIVSLPSASVLAEIRRRSEGRRQPAKQLAVLADPVFEVDDPRVGRKRAPDDGDEAASSTRAVLSRLSRLPFSREEAHRIAALVPADRRLEATDFQASRATATSGELADYRLVHFATHGLFNGDEPALSGLVLSLVDHDGRAQDGFLRLTDIYNLRLAADVVVLSACQTALGKEVRGEGLMGLTRGFMYAGARRVVASLWQVDDLATGELMRRFYTAMLKDGVAPAAALRMAQRDLAREPRWASPFFWSGFQLQGEWR